MRHPKPFFDGEWNDGEVRGMSFLSGKRGSGKTTEAMRLLQQCRGGRVFFDTLSKHALPNYVAVSQPGELKDALRVRSTPRIIYQPRCGNLLEHFEAVNAIVYAVGELVYVVDEIDYHCSASALPPHLYVLVNYGRHSHVAMVFTARRPAQVSRELTGACWEMRLFRTTETRDIRYFADLLGDNRTAESLRTLGNYQYLLWRDDGSEPIVRGGVRRQ